MDNPFFRLFLVAAIFSGFFACTEKPKSELIEINVPSKVNTEVTLNDIADSIQYIQLETRPDAFISRIKEVLLHDDKLYIWYLFQKILVFDLEGKFLGALGKQGEGPGEYRSVSAMAIDDISGEIYLFAGKKIMRYSPEHELIEEKRIDSSLDFGFDFFRILGGERFGISQEYGNVVEGGFANETKLYRFDAAMAVIDTLPLRNVIMEKKIASALGYTDYISSYDGKHFIYTPVTTNENYLRDTLYQLRDMQLKPFAKLNFPKPHLDDRGFKKYYIANVVHTANYISSHFYEKSSLHQFLFHMESGKGYLVKDGFLDEDGDRFSLRVLSAEEDLFYFVKPAAFVSGEQEEANPVIGLVKLK
ncbi:hypothetical protein A33Q_3750 [Indibacter alkaliphilus LW1]|uniref:6-bladed beta-propeller protein n=1 Tax=Indibacter alkaliphilus (strain CCUG 57479 / KCTC 22604 / LW1) TaxID=1189612 RepID=S2DNH2_INDAL|nr:6-bladed beta-propeller [Indibacter alkaliphilus]EOZ93491.1 hypothetical protein A33Q_3750 [Indibacter alkaliphilus LW1]